MESKRGIRILGDRRSVVVEILDAGQELSSVRALDRYVVYAYEEDGRFATCNGADTIATALATVHWHDLDRDPDPGRAKAPWRALFG